MATSFREFNVGLYREHIEEAAFLYEQRLTYLQDPEVNWPALQDWEDRYEAHIDALVLGRDLALDVCRQQITSGDPGDLHVTLCVLCRQHQKLDAFAALNGLDSADPSAARAAAEALCREAPTEWQHDLLGALQRDLQLTAVLARVVGYRRFPSEDVLRTVLARPHVGRAELAWALGRVGTQASAPTLWALLDDPDGRVCEAAAIALLRLGDVSVLRHISPAAPDQAWVRRVLGIGGSPSSFGVLADALRSDGADADTVLALGLLGHLAAVPLLLDLLDNDDLSQSAAVALNTITGAALFTNVFSADEVVADELVENEREAYEKNGTVPTREGRPFGNWERRVLADRAGWQAWLDQNRHRFDREYRWRTGRPYGPSGLLECLKCETSPLAVRNATYEELVIRYGLDVPFEADLPVHQQLRFLGKIGNWVTRQSGSFVDGYWYLAGELQR